jgi:hypothetical protein
LKVIQGFSSERRPRRQTRRRGTQARHPEQVLG